MRACDRWRLEVVALAQYWRLAVVISNNEKIRALGQDFQ
jgi:hypothetical protein